MRKLSETEKAELQRKIARPRTRRKSFFDRLLEVFSPSRGYITNEPIQRINARVLSRRTYTEKRSSYDRNSYNVKITEVVFGCQDGVTRSFKFENTNPLRIPIQGEQGVLAYKGSRFMSFYKNMTMEDINKLSGKTKKAT